MIHAGLPEGHVKWNGIRALAARHTEGWDMWGRELADYRPRYPEMGFLAALPPGTILDGELILLSQGMPDLEAILARHQLTHLAKIQHASKNRLRSRPKRLPQHPCGGALQVIKASEKLD